MSLGLLGLLGGLGPRAWVRVIRVFLSHLRRGILVREGQSTTSKQLTDRLSTGRESQLGTMHACCSQNYGPLLLICSIAAPYI